MSPAFPGASEPGWGRSLKAWLGASLNTDGTIRGGGAPPSMVDFPAEGSEDWHDELYNWLRVAHNADGSIPGGGGGTSYSFTATDPTVFHLAADMRKGTQYTQVSLVESPIDGLGRPTVGWVWEPFTTRCEGFPVWDVAGNVLKFGGPNQDHSIPYTPKFDHPAGCMVKAMHLSEISPIVMGAAGDGEQDDWLYLMRTQYGFGILRGGQAGSANPTMKYKSDRPLLMFDWSYQEELALKFSATTFDPACIQTNIEDGTHYHVSKRTPMMAIAECVNGMVVDAPGTTIKVYGDTLHTESIARFTSIWDEAIPGGLVEGRAYLVKSVTSIPAMTVDGISHPAKALTIAEFDTPSTLVTVTPGKGEHYSGWQSQIHNMMDRVHCESDVPELCGPMMTRSNQPQRTRDQTVHCLAPSGGETAICLGGDLAQNTNTNIRLGRGGAKIGFDIDGNAVVCDTIRVSGLDPDDPTWLGNINAIGGGIGSKGHYVALMHFEGVGLGVDIGGCDSVTIGMIVYNHMPSGIGAARFSMGAGSLSAWQIDKIQTDDLSAPLLVIPGMPTFTSWDGVEYSGVGDTDSSGVFPGIYHAAGLGLVLKDRWSRTWTASVHNVFKMRRFLEGLDLINDTNMDVWLSNPAGIPGHSHWIYKRTGTNNLIVRDHTGTQIGGTLTASGLYRYLYTDHWTLY